MKDIKYLTKQYKNYIQFQENNGNYSGSIIIEPNFNLKSGFGTKLGEYLYNSRLKDGIYNKNFKAQTIKPELLDFSKGNLEKFIKKNYHYSKIPNFKEGLNKIENQIKNGRKITFVVDGDLDGITSAVIIKKTMSMMGNNINSYFIYKSRSGNVSDFEKNVLGKFPDTKLFVFIDCATKFTGISNLLVKRGYEMIVFDHHNVDKNPLHKDAILVNPKVEEYNLNEEIRSYCGTGLAYKLSYELLNNRKLIDFKSRDYYDLNMLFMLGSLGDAAPMLGENFFRIKSFIKESRDLYLYDMHNCDGFSKTHPFLAALYNLTYIEGEKLNGYNITFNIIPVIRTYLNTFQNSENDFLEKYYELINAKKTKETLPIVSELLNENKKRTAIQKAISDKVIEAVRSGKEEINIPVTIDYNIFGNIVGKISNTLKKTACFVLGTNDREINAKILQDDQGNIVLLNKPSIDDPKKSEKFRVSIRSYTNDIFNHLKPYLEDIMYEGSNTESISYGGHELAMGIMFNKDKLKDVLTILTSANPVNTDNKHSIVGSVSVYSLIKNYKEIIDDIDKLEPFGQINSYPVWEIKDIKVENIIISKDGKYGKILIRGVDSGFFIVTFETDLEKLPKKGENIKILGELSESGFGLSINMIDWEKDK